MGRRAIHQYSRRWRSAKHAKILIDPTSAFNISFGTGDGQYMGLMDAGMIKTWVDRAVKDQEATKMNYISAGIATYTGKQ